MMSLWTVCRINDVTASSELQQRAFISLRVCVYKSVFLCVCRVDRRGVEQCFISIMARPWCLGIEWWGKGGEWREEEEEEEEGQRGVTSLCHHSSLVVFHSALTLRSVVLIVAQPRIVCMCLGHCPLLSQCRVCVYTSSDTRTAPEHSSCLTPCIRTERGKCRMKEKCDRGELGQWVWV